jgi:hypothetical protein
MTRLRGWATGLGLFGCTLGNGSELDSFMDGGSAEQGSSASGDSSGAASTGAGDGDGTGSSVGDSSSGDGGSSSSASDSGSNGSDSSSSGAGSSSSGGDGDGDASCSEDDPAPGGNGCPNACTGGCDMQAKRCEIDCIANWACQDDVINCPNGWDCLVTCSKVSSCSGATIHCPADAACELSCDGTWACADAIVQCGSGTCNMNCLSGTSPCDLAQFHCGPRDSRAQCQAPETFDPPEAFDEDQGSCVCEVSGC